MLEAKIRVEKELVAKGYKKGLWFNALKDISYFYAVRLMGVWILVSIVDGLFNQSSLMTMHAYALIGLWIAVSIYEYRKWAKQIEETQTDEYVAILDDIGVIIKKEATEERFNWEFYKDYEEHQDYLQINFTYGGMGIIPRTPELFEVVEFTKNKLPPKKG